MGRQFVKLSRLGSYLLSSNVEEAVRCGNNNIVFIGRGEHRCDPGTIRASAAHAAATPEFPAWDGRLRHIFYTNSLILCFQVHYLAKNSKHFYQSVFMIAVLCYFGRLKEMCNSIFFC